MKRPLSEVAGACWKWLVVAMLVAPVLAQSGVVNSSKNPNQIALKHWYKANLTTFVVGVSPVACLKRLVKWL